MQKWPVLILLIRAGERGQDSYFDSVLVSWQLHSGGLLQWSEMGHKFRAVLSIYFNQPWDLFRNEILRGLFQHSCGITYPSPTNLNMFLFVKWNYMSTAKSFLSVFIYFVYQHWEVVLRFFPPPSLQQMRKMSLRNYLWQILITTVEWNLILSSTLKAWQHIRHFT